jgi:ferric-dicitrate binding protein FerR (iron transport regulator)
MVFVFLSVLMVSVFSFTAVAAWADSLRREREAYYKSETIKKIAEAQGAGADAALALLREQDRIETLRRHEGLRLGGLITVAIGIALGVFLKGVANDPEPVWLVGLIPLAIGLALLGYSYFLAEKTGK